MQSCGSHWFLPRDRGAHPALQAPEGLPPAACSGAKMLSVAACVESSGLQAGSAGDGSSVSGIGRCTRVGCSLRVLFPPWGGEGPSLSLTRASGPHLPNDSGTFHLPRGCLSQIHEAGCQGLFIFKFLSRKLPVLTWWWLVIRPNCEGLSSVEKSGWWQVGVVGTGHSGEGGAPAGRSKTPGWWREQ